MQILGLFSILKGWSLNIYFPQKKVLFVDDKFSGNNLKEKIEKVASVVLTAI